MTSGTDVPDAAGTGPHVAGPGRGTPHLGGPRLRQVALVAVDGGQVAAELEAAFGWPDAFHDPGVGAFGLANSVFAVGDTFVEVVSPVRDGTTAGRYLERRGGDSGYMAIFQVPDLTVARRRLDALGVRVVWRADHDDIAGTHLHPKDVPGAIVSLDWADPPGSWRWAGPAWTGTVPPHQPGGIHSVTVEVDDPAGVAGRWAAVLDLPTTDDGVASIVPLPAAGQRVRFVPAGRSGSQGITEVVVAGLPGDGAVIGGVRFVPETTEPGAPEPEGGAP